MPVTVEARRGPEGAFEPLLVRKHQRRLGQGDEIVLSLTARGFTAGEMPVHVEVYWQRGLLHV